MLVWMGTTCFKLAYTLFNIIRQHQTQGVQTDQRQSWGIARRYWTNMVDPLRRAGRLVMVKGSLCLKKLLPMIGLL